MAVWKTTPCNRKAKISLTQAVTVAEQHANGKARAEYENSKQGWVYDVEVVSGPRSSMSGSMPTRARSSRLPRTRRITMTTTSGTDSRQYGRIASLGGDPARRPHGITQPYIFLWLNAPEHPSALALTLAIFLAEQLIWAVPVLIGIGWLRGGEATRKAMLIASASGLLGLLINQIIGLAWLHPRPFMIGLVTPSSLMLPIRLSQAIT
jgi:hypothetical protein